MRWQDRTEINRLNEKIKELEYSFSWKRLKRTPQFWSSAAAILAIAVTTFYGIREGLIELQSQRLEIAKAEFIRDTTFYSNKIKALKDSLEIHKANIQDLKIRTRILRLSSNKILEQNKKLELNRLALRDQIAEYDPVVSKAKGASSRYNALMFELEKYLFTQYQLDTMILSATKWDLNQKEKSLIRLEKYLNEVKRKQYDKDIKQIISTSINQLGDFRSGRPLNTIEVTTVLTDTKVSLKQSLREKIKNDQKALEYDNRFNHYNYDVPFADTIN